MPRPISCITTGTDTSSLADVSRDTSKTFKSHKPQANLISTAAAYGTCAECYKNTLIGGVGHARSRCRDQD